MTVVPGPVEYYGYDDGGTSDDESDDNYLYYLRWYALYSERDASWGEIWLYDPDFERVSEWAVPMLECVVHEWNDGLVANPEGEVHGVIIPVPVSAMEKAGTYRFVLHFYDDYADSYENHQVKAALEVNCEMCVPEAHNYDGTDFWDAAELASERQRRGGYIARDWTDEDPITAMNRVDREKPTIISITNHGIPGGIYFRRRGTIIDGLTANAYLGPENPFYASGGRTTAIMLHDFKSIKFIAFVGCETAVEHYKLGNLLTASVMRGATCALGFNELVMMGTRQEDDPQTPENEKSDIVREWTKAFWNAALNLPREPDHPEYPEKEKPYGVWDAARYAAEVIKNKFGSYLGWDKFSIFANKLENRNLVLIPPECKN